MKNVTKKIVCANVIPLVYFCVLIPNVASQSDSVVNRENPAINSSSPESTTAPLYKIVIQDAPGKKGQEFGDATLIVFEELILFAAVYRDGKFKSDISVNWYWTHRALNNLSVVDSSEYLGFGKSITFRPTVSDSGYIFATGFMYKGDSTGLITVLPAEELVFFSISSDHSQITQGQKNISVSYNVQNVGFGVSSIKDAGIRMIDPALKDVATDYKITRIDTITHISAGATREFQFLVSANPDADTVLVSIDGELITREQQYYNFEQKHQWQVQTPPLLTIDSIKAQVNEVFQGEDSIEVIMHVSDRGMAAVDSIDAELIFWNGQLDVSTDYEFQVGDDEPALINGHEQISIRFYVNVTTSAILDTIVINGTISAADKNTGVRYFDTGADVTDNWMVFSPTYEELLFSPIFSDRINVSLGQENVMVSFQVQNIGAQTSTIEASGLYMIDADSQNVTDDFYIQRLDSTHEIMVGQDSRFLFHVNIKPDAHTGIVNISGYLETKAKIYSDFPEGHQWYVQSPPQITIDRIEPLVNEIVPGQDSIGVIMHLTNHGMASYNILDANLSFWHGGDDVSAEYQFNLAENSLSMVAGESSASIRFSVQAIPDATFGVIIINGAISGSDVNNPAGIYIDNSADIWGSWIVTNTSAAAMVTIESVKIVCPNADQMGNGDVNVNQHFSVSVDVKNIGGHDLKNISVSVSSNGHSQFITNQTQVITEIFKGQSATIFYNFTAFGNVLPASEHFLVRIDSAFDQSDGDPALIEPPIDNTADITIEHPAALFLMLDNDCYSLPVGQKFTMNAIVLNDTLNSGCDTTGILTIQIPSGYSLIEGNVTKPFKQNEAVSWNIQSPVGMPQGPDSVWVFISQVPYNENDPATIAQVLVDSVYALAQTLESRIEITDVHITAPAGATDGILSTDQFFFVQGKFVSQKSDRVYARLITPSSYVNLENEIKFLDMDSVVTWKIQAPHFSHQYQEMFVIEAWGNIEHDTTTILCTPDSSLSISTIDKAQLKVTAEIIDPPSALNGQIYPGLEFQIRGDLINLGQAGTNGNKSLCIDPQDNQHFTILGNSIYSLNDGEAVWTIRASDILADQITLIKIKIHDIPNDENTDAIAYINENDRTAEIAVIDVKQVLKQELMVKQNHDVAAITIAAGETDVLMALECINLAEQSYYPITLLEIAFDVENKENRLILPSEVMTGFRVRNVETVFGEATLFSSNPVRVSLQPSVILQAQESIQFFMEVDFHESLSQPFKIRMKESSYIKIFSQANVQIVDEFRNNNGILNIYSYCPVIFERDFKKSFHNYPNPFGSRGKEKPTLPTI